MTDSRPEQSGEGRPEPDAPAWHSFGVPHGGAPEPPPYTPAMRERPRGEMTQPIDTSATQEVRPEESRPWWTTPGTAGSESSRSSEPPTPLPRSRRPPVTRMRRPGLRCRPAPRRAGARCRPRDRAGRIPRPCRPDPRRPSAAPGRGCRWPRSPSSPLSSAARSSSAASSCRTDHQSRVGGPGAGSGVDGPAGRQHRQDRRRRAAERGHHPDRDRRRQRDRVRLRHRQPGPHPHQQPRRDGGWQPGTITVELNNGKTLPAKIVGSDASSDLAVLKIDATDIPPLQFGASKDVVVGDGVIAVGAPLGLDATVTSGIVSALNRPVTPGDGSDQSFINAIQTDAAINPGNSGGPLLDMNGKVIGVNSAIARIPGSTSDSGGNIGVGFAVPSDQASKTAQQLITTGKADHPALGVRVDRSYTGDGAEAGLRRRPGGQRRRPRRASRTVTSSSSSRARRSPTRTQLIVAIRARNVGDNVKMKVQRGGQTTDVTMTLQSATS